MNHKKFMKLAIKEARNGLKTSIGEPYGACIVKKGRVIALGRSTVFKDNDATAHAEVNAIRKASKKLETYDLSSCAIYCTTEPCPMCFTAIHWAGIKRIIYGSSISDSKKIGFAAA
jgi:guanine deaminase